MWVRWEESTHWGRWEFEAMQRNKMNREMIFSGGKEYLEGKSWKTDYRE